MEFEFVDSSLLPTEQNAAAPPQPQPPPPPAPSEPASKPPFAATYASPGRLQRALRRATQARISTPQLLERKRRRADQAAALRDTGRAGGAAAAEAQPREGEGAGIAIAEVKTDNIEIGNGCAWPTDLQLRSSISFRSSLPFGWLERSGAVEASVGELSGHSTQWRRVGAAGSHVLSLSLVGAEGEESAKSDIAVRACPSDSAAATSPSISPSAGSARIASNSACLDVQAATTLLSAMSYLAYPSTHWPAAMLAATSSVTERLFQSVVSKLREWEAKNRIESKIVDRAICSTADISSVDKSGSKSDRVGEPVRLSTADPAPAAKSGRGSGHRSVVSNALAAADRASRAANTAGAVLSAMRQFPPTLLSSAAERSAATAIEASRAAHEAGVAAKAALVAKERLSKQSSGEGGERSSGGGLSSSDIARLHVLLDRAEKTVATTSLAAKAAAEAANAAADDAKSAARAAEAESEVNVAAETSSTAGTSRGMASSKSKRPSFSSSSSSAIRHDQRNQKPSSSAPSSFSSSSHPGVALQPSLHRERETTSADPDNSISSKIISESQTAHFSPFPSLTIPTLHEWMPGSTFTSDARFPSSIAPVAPTFSASGVPKLSATTLSLPTLPLHIYSEPVSTVEASTKHGSMPPPPPKRRALDSRGESKSASALISSSSTTSSKGELKPARPQPRVVQPVQQPQICGLPREAYASIASLLQAVSLCGEVDMISMWLDRVFRFQEALASAWATLVVSSSQHYCQLPSRSVAKSASDGQRSSAVLDDEENQGDKQFSPLRDGLRLHFFLLRFGPSASTGNVVIFGHASALLSASSLAPNLGPDAAGSQSPADRKRMPLVEGDQIVAIIARSSRTLRLLLTSAGCLFSTPLDPTLRQHDHWSTGSSATELGELARYDRSVSASGAGTFGVSKEVLGLFAMSLGHDSPESNIAPPTDTSRDENDDNGQDDVSLSEPQHESNLSTFSSTAAAHSLRGSEESQGSLLLVSGADQCRMLAQLLLESVSPGSLSPPPLLSALFSKQTVNIGAVSKSIVPPRTRLPLACIALIGSGQNSQAGNRASSDAAIHLDVPQIFAFGLGDPAAPPFRNACASALDLRVREVSELSTESAAQAFGASAGPRRRYELEAKGAVLPLALPRLALLVAAMQAREARRPWLELQALDEQVKGSSGVLVEISSTPHLATKALAGSGDAGTQLSSALLSVVASQSGLSVSEIRAAPMADLSSFDVVVDGDGGGSNDGSGERDMAVSAFLNSISARRQLSSDLSSDALSGLRFQLKR